MPPRGVARFLLRSTAAPPATRHPRSLLPRRPFVILNPAAQGDRARRRRDRVASLLPRGAVVELTTGPGDAGRLAREAVAAGFRTVVAGGGDGTVNEVVNGLVEAGNPDVRLGLMPLGTMNVFAAELGIPGNRVARAWEIIAAGHCRQVDLARANGRSFVQMAGIGFDAQAVSEVDWEMKKNLGPLSYVLSAARVAARELPRLVVTAADGLTCEGCLVLVGNGRFYGGPFAVFKEARLDDGQLDVIVCRSVTHLDLLRYLPNVLFGTHLDLEGVEFFHTPALSVHPACAGERIPYEIDGEIAGAAPVDFSLQPGALRVLAPAPKGGPPRPARFRPVTLPAGLMAALKG